jgi:hypothetical protein
LAHIPGVDYHVFQALYAACWDVNDNHGDFTAEFSDIVRSACDGARPMINEAGLALA